ncbi:GNAT family N-acetyltransferase [Streptomyces lydicus]|uniref:GNAT family N-acetyltransferase n=1 Tax=Streptomyces lydicus TaxID=47763 RepID=UPI000ABDACDC
MSQRPVTPALDDRIADGRCLLWEAGGRPVSMAGITRTLVGTARVAPVYTPPELRGRGYAGAVTAAVSQAAKDSGAQEVLLFTDLANPTSNALYRRLGYRPVEDYLVLTFE